MKSYILLLFLTCVLGLSAHAQIVDDSTLQVYGTNTVNIFYEDDLYNGDTSYHSIDTTTTHFRYFHPVRQSGYTYQDLGHNYGTAIKPLFYSAPSSIGVHWGFDAYTPYVLQPKDVKHYNTRSPFSSLQFAQGGKGQQNIKVAHSRNITPFWNFGFTYERINTFKQYAATGNRNEDAILELYNGSFDISRTSKSGKYKMLMTYTNFNHHMHELGGIDGPQDSIYLYNEEKSQLKGKVKNWQSTNKLRFYQEYKLKLFDIFMTNQYHWQRDSYRDDNLSQNVSYYLTDTAAFIVSSKEMLDDYKYKNFSNQIGIKGKIGATQYWAYLKRRDFGIAKSSYSQYYKMKGQSENYIGGRIRLNIKEDMSFSAKGEYFIGKDYLLSANFNTKWAKIGAKSVLYAPTIKENFFFSNLGSWNSDFKRTHANEIFGKGKVDFKGFSLSPFGKYSIVNHYIYFTKVDGAVKPVQLDRALHLYQVGVDFSYNIFKNYFITGDVRYTDHLRDLDVVKSPKLLGNIGIYYDGSLHKDVVFGKIGADINFHSHYYADAYMPALKQFYVQDDYFVRFYPLIDLYASFRIKGKFKAYIKVNHLNEKWFPTPYNGYTVTPDYAGMRRTFVLGFRWLFFD